MVKDPEWSFSKISDTAHVQEAEECAPSTGNSQCYMY